MAAGLGVTQYMSSIETVERSEDGLLAVRARGAYGPTLPGTWLMTLDPDTDYLIREASFVADGEEIPVFLIGSSGNMELGNSTIGTEGMLTFRVGTGNPYEISVSIGSVSVAANTQLLGEVRDRISQELTEPSEIIDYRESPPVRTFLGE